MLITMSYKRKTNRINAVKYHLDLQSHTTYRQINHVWHIKLVKPRHLLLKCLYTLFILGFGTVPKVWYVFVFHFCALQYLFDIGINNVVIVITLDEALTYV